MKNAERVVIAAIVAGLRADTTLAALNAGRVYDQPPPMRMPGGGRSPEMARYMPSTSLGPTRVTAFSRRGKRGCSVSGTIDNWAEAREAAADQMVVVRRMNEAVQDWIDSVDLSISGWVVHGIVVDDDVRTDPDITGRRAHGEVPYRVDLTPT